MQTAGILVKSRSNEISENSSRCRRRRDEPEVPRMADVNAVRQKLLLKLPQDVLRCGTALRRLIKKCPYCFGIDVRSNLFLIDGGWVIGQ